MKVKERVDKELERFQIEQVQPEEFLRVRASLKIRNTMVRQAPRISIS